MQNHDIRSPVIPVVPLAEKRATLQAELKNSATATGTKDMEARVAELETHLKYIRRDMDEMRGDVKSIKHRLVYSAGGTVVVLGLLVWIANSRFDQLVMLLTR
jgi:Flp pilus assembly protein TadB